MTMLPTNTTSSIQSRRATQHRRQKSLEASILATADQTPQTIVSQSIHRRGLSLDQSLRAMAAPSGPLPPQDTNGTPSAPGPGPSARNHPPTTNTGHPLDQQHFIKQVTQQHSLAQPGLPAHMPLQAPNFQTHLQQQLGGLLIGAPISEQQAAMQELQNHMMWYQQKFANATASTNNNLNTPSASLQQANTAGSDSAPLIPGNPPRTVAHSHSNTVPNTPQTFMQCWSSPPTTHAKPRSQSFNVPQGQIITPNASFSTESFTFTADSDYAPSTYSSSSIADPSSPPQHHNTPLPTLFEEPCASMPVGGPLMIGEPLLIPTNLAGEPDFNHPNFLIGGARAVCQEQAMLDAAGIEADYIDPGIPDDELFSYLNQPTSKTAPYTCKFEGCDARINRKENARSHVQNHLNIRPWHCRLCDKAFCRMHDTKRHHLTHTQERPAVCPCGKTFARADALTRHRQRDMCEGVLPGFEKLEKDKPKRGRPRKDRSSDPLRKSHRPDMSARTHKAHLTRAFDAAAAQSRISRPQYGSDSSDLSDRSLPNTPPQDSDAMDTDDFLTTHDGDEPFSDPTIVSHHHSWIDTPPTSPTYLHATQLDNKNSRKLFIDLNNLQGPPSDLHSMSQSPFHSPTPRNANTHSQLSLEWPSSPLDTTHSHPSATFPDSAYMGGSSPLSNTDLFSEATTNAGDFDLLSAHNSSSAVNPVDVFSPAADSCSGSSTYNSDLEPIRHHLHEAAAADCAAQAKSFADVSTTAAAVAADANEVFSAAGIDDFLSANDQGDQYDEIREFLDNWGN